MPIYRILAFFQKYDILGKFHSDVLFGDEFEGFASDCADFAEMKSVVGLQENLSGYTSAAIFGDITESVSLDSSIKSRVYSDKFGGFNSPVLVDNKIEGLSASAKLGRYDNGVNLSSDFAGFQSAVKTGGSQSSVLLPSNADGFNSTPAFGAASESIIGGLSVKDFKSTPVFGASNETIELQSSIKATVISPTPSATILAGVYGRKSPVTLTEFEIPVPITYIIKSDVEVLSATSLEARSEGVSETIINFHAWRDKAQEDGDLIAAYIENFGFIMLTEGDTFTVTADTVVTETEYQQFHNYFTPAT